MNSRGASVLFVLALVLAVRAPFAAAQQGATLRFSNWEFTPPPMMEKAEQTADKLVFKLDKSVPGPGGTLTLQAGRPLQGTLAARLDAEWKRLTKGRKLLEVKPDSQTELMDGTQGLAREATTANGGFFSITVFPAPNNGVDLLQMDAADDMATQMLGGTTVGFFMSIKLHPVGGETATAAAPAAPPAETPQQELARLQKEIRESPPSAYTVPEMSAPAPAPAEPRDVDPIPVPKRDDAQIARIPAAVPNDSQLARFVRETATLAEAKLPEDIRTTADRIARAIGAQQGGYVAQENAAIGLYLEGNLQAAVALMGKAAAAHPEDSNTLNNYAAFLSMAGAQQPAIVILQSLDKKFPDNTTVLNNLGQAWFALGDVDKADKFLGRVIWLRPGHSQANFTRSVLDEVRGDKRGAIDSMRKSMKQGYSEDKLAQLERLGYTIGEKDIPWNAPFKEDPLKLHKAVRLIPPYYTKAKDSLIAQAQWDAFHATIDEMKRQVEAEERRMEPVVEQSLFRFQRDLMAGRKRFSPLAMKFTLKYITYGKRNEELMAQAQRWQRDAEELARKIDVISEDYQKRTKAAQNETCEASQALATEFMSKVNPMLRDAQSEPNINARIRWFNEWAQIFRYYNTPTKETYQAALLSLKYGFLSYLSGFQHYQFPNAVCSGSGAGKQRRRGLVYFEDIHCNRHITFTVPMIGVIRMNCHYLETEFDIAGVVKGTTKEDVISDQFVRGTLEVGASKKLSPEGSPLELKAKGGGFIEVDSHGISDAGLEAGIEASAGAVSASATARAGFNSGVSADADATVETAVEAGDMKVGTNVRMGVNSGVTANGVGALTGLSAPVAW